MNSSDDKIPPKSGWKSVRAVFLGFVAVFVLSLGTDELLHLLQVYPPWSEPMFDPGLNLLALAYRCVYGVVGGAIIAKYAPRAPMRHVWAGGLLGLTLSTAGVFAAIGMNLGPMWYPIALALSALPTTLLGGMLYLRRAAPANRS